MSLRSEELMKVSVALAYGLVASMLSLKTVIPRALASFVSPSTSWNDCEQGAFWSFGQKSLGWVQGKTRGGPVIEMCIVDREVFSSWARG